MSMYEFIYICSKNLFENFTLTIFFTILNF